MSRATQTIGAGFKALGGANLASFTLEFLSQSGNRRAGTTETIVVPYAEMGRDRSCAIRFDSSETTVSRKHASISHENGQYFITALSQTNQTFVNGAPINSKSPLNNGSEIQLSSNGPRMRFLASQTKTSTMRLTQRMQMFTSQSLRPYRRAVMLLSIVFVAALSGLGYYAYDLGEKADLLSDDIDDQKELIGDLEDKNAELIGSLSKVSKDQAALKRNLRKQNKINDSIRQSMASEEQISSVLADWEADVYGIEITYLTFSIDGELSKHTLNTDLIGTGFLLKDGKFVTALHVIMPWLYQNDWHRINKLHTAGDYVKIEIEAISPKGKRLRLSSDDFNYDLSGFDLKTDSEGNKYRAHGKNSLSSDWAWIQTDRKGQIEADFNLSKNLAAGKTIYTLGYMYGLAQQSGSYYNPLLSKMSVAQKGLDRGLIKISGRTFDGGNSGGPALVVDSKGQLKAVGIVAHSNMTDEGKESYILGGIVPLTYIDN
jgi:pSer/pThr/pTyr-binding forkhead associated (FHA) protein